MSDAVVEALTLTLDLLEWLAACDRTYEEAMDAWRTSCPKLPVWEDANDRGLIARQSVNGREVVRITSLGIALPERRRSSRTKGWAACQYCQARHRIGCTNMP
jgi:D-3-phosphoglycerate dehydrogenase